MSALTRPRRYRAYRTAGRFQMFISSFWDPNGSVETGYTFSLSNWTNYPNNIIEFAPFFIRSMEVAAQRKRSQLAAGASTGPTAATDIA